MNESYISRVMKASLKTPFVSGVAKTPPISRASAVSEVQSIASAPTEQGTILIKEGPPGPKGRDGRDGKDGKDGGIVEKTVYVPTLFGNLDGGKADSIYGGMTNVDGGTI